MPCNVLADPIHAGCYEFKMELFLSLSKPLTKITPYTDFTPDLSSMQLR